MELDGKARAFIAKNQSAAMITLRKDGSPHSVRVGVALVEGKLWSSGTRTRARTRHLRRDPRCNLFVFERAGAGYLSLDAIVTILDGDNVPELSVQLFRVMQQLNTEERSGKQLQWFGREMTEDQFKQAMVSEERLIYEFQVLRATGVYG